MPAIGNRVSLIGEKSSPVAGADVLYLISEGKSYGVPVSALADYVASGSVAYASVAQGVLADSAVQPAEMTAAIEAAFADLDAALASIQGV